jgi:hypothetical protein
MYQRPLKLIHKELQSQDLETLKYKDMQYIRRNIHAPTCFVSQQIYRNSCSIKRCTSVNNYKEQFLPVNDSVNYIAMFSCKINL